MDGLDKSTVAIDNEYYNINEQELSLLLMTEEGLDELDRFTRLERLTVTPYKTAALMELEASGEDIRNIPPVYDTYTEIDSLWFLEGMTQLTKLDIACCNVSDSTQISQMKNLKSLNISYNSFTSLDFLAQMDSIENLDITGLEISDYTPLLQMDSLSYLRLDKGIDKPTADSLADKGVTIMFNVSDGQTEEYIPMT